MRNAPTVTTRIINFLGSMNLAISLLVILAIASVIGTILKQNQPYTDYQIKFGPFWFDIFKSLGLYDVYSAVWFLTILAFLVISTTTCVGRNTPRILRELRHFRENVQEKSLRAMHHSYSTTVTLDNTQAQSLAERILKAQGFKTRLKAAEDHSVIAGMKGGANYWGYLLTHVGMIVIIVGAGIFDNGSLRIRLAELSGTLQPETRNVPASEVPKTSQLPAENTAYRGNVDIPEGGRANLIFLSVRDGYVIQNLPFSVEVKDFRVEHYSTGMPKSFESDIVIHDKTLDKPLERTISVNHPLVYKDIAIYQANFGDGGSKLNMTLYPFSNRYAPQDLTGNVFKQYDLTSSDQKYTLELGDFRLFNINDMEEPDGKLKKRNVGPSMTFKLRDATGQAMEYQNYMNPINIQGNNYFVSGVRASQAEPFRYLHIPVDSKGGVDRFMRFLSDLQNDALVKRLATETTQSSMQQAQVNNTEMSAQVADTMSRLTLLFATQGSTGIDAEIKARFPADKQASASETFMKVLEASLRTVYQETLKQEGFTGEPGKAEWQFFDDSIMAIDKVAQYGSPWFIRLNNFQHIEASGLQISRSPGKDVVYLGSAMLTLGIFLMFYVAHRRIWVWIKPLENNQAELVLAGSSNRNMPEFERYFASLESLFKRALGQEVNHHVNTPTNH